MGLSQTSPNGKVTRLACSLFTFLVFFFVETPSHEEPPLPLSLSTLIDLRVLLEVTHLEHVSLYLKNRFGNETKLSFHVVEQFSFFFAPFSFFIICTPRTCSALVSIDSTSFAEDAVNKQVNEYKIKLQKADQEIATLQATVRHILRLYKIRWLIFLSHL